MADSKLMSFLLKENYKIEFPENIKNPFEEIKNLLFAKTARGIGDKIILANKVIKEGFSIINAASHPQCSSAAYFLQKLNALN